MYCKHGAEGPLEPTRVRLYVAIDLGLPQSGWPVQDAIAAGILRTPHISIIEVAAEAGELTMGAAIVKVNELQGLCTAIRFRLAPGRCSRAYQVHETSSNVLPTVREALLS